MMKQSTINRLEVLGALIIGVYFTANRPTGMDPLFIVLSGVAGLMFVEILDRTLGGDKKGEL